MNGDACISTFLVFILMFFCFYLRASGNSGHLAEIDAADAQFIENHVQSLNPHQSGSHHYVRLVLFVNHAPVRSKIAFKNLFSHEMSTVDERKNIFSVGRRRRRKKENRIKFHLLLCYFEFGYLAPIIYRVYSVEIIFLFFFFK